MAITDRQRSEIYGRLSEALRQQTAEFDMSVPQGPLAGPRRI